MERKKREKVLELEKWEKDWYSRLAFLFTKERQIKRLFKAGQRERWRKKDRDGEKKERERVLEIEKWKKTEEA